MFNGKLTFLSLWDVTSFFINTLLSFPLVVFQAIIFFIYFSVPSFLCLIVAIIINLLVWGLVSASETKTLMDMVNMDYVKRFSKCRYKYLTLPKLLGLENSQDDMIYNIDSRLQESSYALKDNNIFKFLDKEIIGSVFVYQVEGAILSPVAYSGGHGSIIFLPKDKLPLRCFQKFLVYHEIGHTLPLAKLMTMEAKIIRILYVIMLFFIPFELEQVTQSILLFLLFFLSSLDFFGNAYQWKIHRAKLQSEVMADEFAVQKLTDKEKEQLLKKLKSGSHPRFLYDKSLTFDENNIRLERLISRLQNNPTEDSILVNISSWDNQYRFLFLFILALNSYNPTYWHVIFFGVLAVLFGCFVIDELHKAMGYSKRFHDYFTYNS